MDKQQDTGIPDAFELMQQFYLSSFYKPNPGRPADTVQDAIRFVLDRLDGFKDVRELCAIFDRYATDTGVFEDADQMVNDLERFNMHEKLTDFIYEVDGGGA